MERLPLRSWDQAAAAVTPELAALILAASGGAGGISATMNRTNSASSSIANAWLCRFSKPIVDHRLAAQPATADRARIGAGQYLDIVGQSLQLAHAAKQLLARLPRRWRRVRCGRDRRPSGCGRSRRTRARRRASGRSQEGRCARACGPACAAPSPRRCRAEGLRRRCTPLKGNDTPASAEST